MSNFTGRMMDMHAEARALCAQGRNDAELPVRAEDFCALFRILFACFKEESDSKNIQGKSGVLQ